MTVAVSIDALLQTDRMTTTTLDGLIGSNASRALASLATKMSTIATVRTGRSALETTSATLPVITIASQTDARMAEQVYDEIIYVRRVLIEYKCKALDDYQTTMDNALQQIRRQLMADAGDQWLGGYALALRETGATFYHPAESGSDAAIQVAVEFDYFD